jgi:hypothetical protein
MIESVGKVKDFRVIKCERNEISQFVENWHYSKNVNGLTISHCFKLLDTTDTLIGAMIYGKIAMANVWKKYADSESDIIELKRLCCIDNTPKNTESFFIGSTLRYLKKHTTIKKVISYADSFYGHEGVIYKASNFDFIGKTSNGRFIIYNDKRYHDKTIRTKYKGKIKPFAQRIIEALESGEATYQNTGGKYIYMYKL